MKTRPLYNTLADDFQTISLDMDELLDHNSGIYDNNWIVSADDLFGKMDLLLNDYDPDQNLAA